MGGGKEAGNREAHTGNRADPATQADAEHSRSSKSSFSYVRIVHECMQVATSRSYTAWSRCVAFALTIFHSLSSSSTTKCPA
jgi:hypothetical protein